MTVVCSVAMSGQSTASKSTANRFPQFVSMVSLLAAPDKYEGKFIRVQGFLTIGFESDALYLHEEDYTYGLTKNSFTLHLTEEQEKEYRVLDKKYVLLEGMFSGNGPDAREMTSGGIFKITRLEVWGPLGDIKH
jgi:glyoxylate utilization-related uncharacterized protein